MTRKLKRGWLLAGLGLLTAMHGAGRVAEAGTSLNTKTIMITGGYKPGTGDPPFDYVFEVFLEPQPDGSASKILSGDSFTIGTNGTQNTPLVGIAPGSFSNVTFPSPPPAPDYSWSYPTITEINTKPPFASLVQWTYNGPNPVTADAQTGQVFLGQFEILTTSSFHKPPMPAGTVINYEFTYDGQTKSGTGSFVLSAVPEPSSVVLLAAGVVALPVFWLRDRRRRAGQNVA